MFAFMTTYGQDIPEGYKKINEFLVPVDLLDPAYPVMKTTDNPVRDAQDFQAELRTYAKHTGKLPEYVYTGDVIKDQANYEESIRMFLEKHPYFPQPGLTIDPQKDADVFECLWKGYFKYFPKRAQRVIVIEKGGVK